MIGLRKPPDWMSEGLCAQVDPEVWFPEKGGPTREAKRICNGRPANGDSPAVDPCPVRQQCLQFSLVNEERFGIWGGMSERERRPLLRRRGRPLTVVQQRRRDVAEYLGKGWSPAAVAQLLGVPVYQVWTDRRALQDAS